MKNWEIAATTETLKLLDGHVEFPDVDHRLAYLFDHFPCDKLTAVEFGCWHGWHTTSLARRFNHVTAIDVRPINIAKTLLRLHLLDLKNVDTKLANVDVVDFKCDVLVHLGVLYHLFSPVAHLHRVLPKCGIICLDTHINKPGLKEAVEVYKGKTYSGGVYSEFGWNDALSGVDETSLWLDESVLKKVIDDCGFGIVHEHRHEVAAGPRLLLVAMKPWLM